MKEKNIEGLYNYLKDNSLDAGSSLDDFQTALQSPKNRMSLYEYIKSNGGDTNGEFDEFENALGFSPGTSTAEMTPAPEFRTDFGQYDYESVVPKGLDKNLALADGNRLAKASQVTGLNGDEKYGLYQQPRTFGQAAGAAYNRYSDENAGRYRYEKTLNDAIDNFDTVTTAEDIKDAVLVPELQQYYNENKLQSKDVFNRWHGKVEKKETDDDKEYNADLIRRLKAFQEEDDLGKDISSRHKAKVESIGQSIAEGRANLEDVYKLEKENNPQGNLSGRTTLAAIRFNPELTKIRTAKQLYDEAEYLNSDIRQQDKWYSFFANAWEKGKLAKGDLATLGLASFFDAMDIKEVLEKIDREKAFDSPEKVLTQGEKALLDALGTKIAAGIINPDESYSAKVAGTTVDMLGFIEQMFVSGGVTGAASKVAQKSLTKWIANSIKNKAAAKVIGIAGETGIAAARAAAEVPLQAGTYKNIIGDMVQVAPDNVNYNYGSGKWDVTGVTRNENAIFEGLSDQFTEVFTERGGLFTPMGQLIKATPWAQKAINSSWGRKLGNFYDGFSNSSFGKLATQGGVQPFSEYLEEVDGWFQRGVYGKGFDSEFWTADSQIPMLIAFAIPGVLGGTVSARNTRVAGKRYDAANADFDSFFSRAGLSAQETDELKNSLLVQPVGMLGIRARQIAEQTGKTAAEQQAAYNTVSAWATYRNAAEMVNSRLREQREQAMETAIQQAEEAAAVNINPDMDAEVVMSSGEEGAPDSFIINGHVSLLKAGGIDFENSDKTVYVRDAAGKTVPVPLRDIQGRVTITPRQQVVERSAAAATAPIIKEQADEDAPETEDGDFVRVGQTGVGTIVGQDESGNDIVRMRGTGAEISVRPSERTVINNVRDIMPDSRVKFTVKERDAQGNVHSREVIGTVEDITAFEQGGVFVVEDEGGKQYNVDEADIIGTVEENTGATTRIAPTKEEIPPRPSGTPPTDGNTSPAPAEEGNIPPRPDGHPSEGGEKSGEAERKAIIDEIAARAPRQKNDEIDYDALLEQNPEDFAALYEEEEGQEEMLKELSSVSENLSKKIQSEEKKLQNATSINKKKEARKAIAELSERKKRIDGLIESRNVKQETKGIQGETEQATVPQTPATETIGTEQANTLIAQMEENAVEAPRLELTPENWESEFGEDGIVKTPLGEAKMGDNQYRKIIQNGRQKEFGMIKPTLTNPDVIIEVSSEAKEGQETERPSSYLFVKTFNINGKKLKFFTSVTVSKDGMEVVVSNHIENLPRMRGFLKNGRLLYQRADMVPGAEVSGSTSTGQSTEADNSAGTSADKGTKKKSNNNTQAKEKENPDRHRDSPTAGNQQKAFPTPLNKETSKEVTPTDSDFSDAKVGNKNNPAKGKRKIYTKPPEKQTPNSKALSKFDYDDLPLRQKILYNIAGGQKFVWDNIKSKDGSVISYGLSSSLFGRASENDRRGYFNILASPERGGVTLEQYAHSLWEEFGSERGYDTQDILSEIIDVLKSLESDMSKLNDPYEEMSEEEAVRLAEYERQLDREEKLTPAQQREIESSIAEYDSQIADAEKELQSAKNAQQKKFSEINNRNGLFGDTKYDPDSMFGDQSDFSEENTKSVMQPFNDKVAKAESDLQALRDNRERAVEKIKSDVIAQTEIQEPESSAEEEDLSLPFQVVPTDRTEGTPEAVNERFNEELDRFAKGELKPHEKLHLGKPLDILQAAGVKGGEITLSSDVLNRKLEQHGLTTDDLRNLAKAVQTPIMVYEWGTKAKSTVIVTELTTKDGRKITVALRAENKEEKLEVNEIASIHGKAAERFLSEMENAKEGGLKEALRYVQKEKALDWLGLTMPIPSQELNSAAKVIENFENPALSDKKPHVSGKKMQPVSKKAWEKLIERLKKSGLARNVFTDEAKMREYLDKYLGKAGAERFMTLWHGSSNNSIKDKDRKVLRTDENGRNIVWENDDYFVATSNPGRESNAPYTTLWDKKTGKKVGFMRVSYNNYGAPDGFLSVDNVEIEKQHRGKGLAKELYRAAIDFSGEKVKGLSSYLPNRINKKQVPHIWEKLGGVMEDGFQNIRFMATSKGEVYGFVTPEGDVYLDPGKMNTNTPIHEFGHLFWNVMPKEMKDKITELLKKTPGWEKLSSNPAYAKLKTDDQKADELFNTLLGDYGEYSQKVREITGEDISLLARVQNVINEVLEWIKANVFGNTDAKLNQFAKRTLGELLGGKEIASPRSQENSQARTQSKTQYANQPDYDFDVSGITEANAQEMKRIKETAVANGTFMKAPNGEKSRLNERQWLQVRTEAFKKWFGNWENSAKYDYLLSENWVKTLTGNEFQKDEIPLTDKVTQYYLDNYNGQIERKGLGIVELTKEGVKDSMAHGIGSVKSAAYAAVPEIIKDGVIIDRQKNWKGRGKDTYVIAAPVQIGNKGYTGIVVVTQSTVKNKFYLHEVVLQENLRIGFKTGTQSGSPIGDFAKILQNFETAKKNSSKVVDENGEPMVVYHYSPNKGFTVFDNTKSKNGYSAFYFSDRPLRTTNEYEESRAFFLNIKEPYQYKGYSIYDTPGNDVPAAQVTEERMKSLQDKGFDGGFYVNNKGGNVIEYTAFSPSQIKSATDNNGNFDDESDDIRFQLIRSKKTAKQINAEIAVAESETDTSPTEAQKKAGNYKKGHVNIQGFDISIEQPKGSMRRGVDESGRAWETKMNNTYGYFGKTESKDGDHIDVFLGNNPLSNKVFVIDQINPETGAFDEHKVMFGFDNISQAQKAYLSNYEKGWRGLGNITETNVDAFRKWAVEKEGKRVKPFADYAEISSLSDPKPVYEDFNGDITAFSRAMNDWNKRNLEKSEKNSNFVENNSDEEGRTETRMDNRRAVGESSLRGLVGGGEKGGRIEQTIAEANAAGGGGTSAGDKRQTWNKQRFLGKLELTARENGTWIDNIESVASKAIGKGYENETYYAKEGKNVVKLNNFNFLNDDSTQYENTRDFDYFIERLYAHNQLFPDVEYKITGFAENSLGEVCIVMTQPLVENAEYASMEQIENWLDENGFEPDVKPDGMKYWTNGQYELSDLKPQNVLLDTNGDLRFIDTDIVPVWGESSSEIDTGISSAETEQEATEGKTTPDPSEGGEVRFQATNGEESEDDADWKAEFEKALSKSKWEQRLVDRFLPVKKLLDTLKKAGVKIAEYNDWYLTATHLSGKNQAEFEQYKEKFLEPLEDVTGRVMDRIGVRFGKDGLRATENYMLLKHGLERNVKMAENDLAAKKKLKEDYAGIYAVAAELWADRHDRKFKSQADLNAIMKDRDFVKERDRIIEDYVRDFEEAVGGTLLSNELKDENERFNEELQQYIDGKISSTHQFNIGTPKGVLSSLFSDISFRIKQDVLRKAKEKHGIDLSSLKNLPVHLNAPIAVFKSKEGKGKVILTEIKDGKGNNIVAAIHLNETAQQGNRYFEVNDIRSLYGKEKENVAHWINGGLLEYSNKKKSLNYISEPPSPSNSGRALGNRELFNSAAKVIQNFENSKLSGKKKGSGLIAEFWERKKAATDFSLRRQYLAGIIDKETYDELKGMYEYYVPLRGHDRTTAEDVYDYGRNMGTYYEGLKTAKGRRSRAESPLAFISQMAQTAIVEANRNIHNLALLRIATEDTTGLVTASKMWYDMEGNALDAFSGLSAEEIERLISPNPSEGGEAIQQRIADFEAKMRAEKKAGKVTQNRNRLNLGGMFIKPAQEKQHTVEVYQNGKAYTVYFNTNPEVARVINGTDVPRMPEEWGLLTDAVQLRTKFTRGIAELMTSKNPEFTFTNASRDFLFASTVLPVQEGIKYSLKFQKNFWSGRAAGAMRRHIFWELDLSRKDDALLYEYIINGGVTGYSTIMSMKGVKSNIEREILKGNKDNAVKKIWDFIGDSNELIENNTRLAVYMTSREQGRSIAQSIHDAKDVTL
ncbi:MAG: hypothetical protein LBJ17_08750, partial [Dysgonamonadaceae bacterium]|nr:hypothetical protein [Dysgonamonadaceae bacterium]